MKTLTEMKFAQKLSAVAVLSALSGGAFAIVAIDAGTGATKIASEQNVSGTVTLVGAGAGATFGANMPVATQAYVRFDVAGGGAKFAAAPTPSFTSGCVNSTAASNATITVAQGGTTADSFVILSMACPVTDQYLVTSNSVNIAANINVTSAATVTVQYRLYETLTAAVNQTANTALKDKTANYITFTPAISNSGAASDAVASVSASPAYTSFTTQTATGSTLVVALNRANAAVAATVNQAGSAIPADANTVLNNAALKTVVTVTGDFTAAQNAGPLYNGTALARVFLSNATDCSAATYNAMGLSATGATWNNVVSDALFTTNGLTVCYRPNTTTAIPASTYTGSVAWTALTGYTVAGFNMTTANITRDGTTMIAPLAQVPTGWISRLVLTNIGTADRAYAVAAVGENGATVALTGAAASGTLLAGKDTVIDLATLMTVTGTGMAPRSALVVTVNAPKTQISGLYQIVNGTSNTISNHVLDIK